MTGSADIHGWGRRAVCAAPPAPVKFSALHVFPIISRIIRSADVRDEPLDQAASSVARLRVLVMSSGMPGPMVVATVPLEM